MPFGVAACLAGLAYVALCEGRAGAAARLFGASETLRRRIGGAYDVVDRVEYERGAAAARAALPPEEFKALWAAGQRLTAEEAVALARGQA